LAANTHTGFMFLSAFGDTEIVEEATRMGALGYLVKPLDVKQIVPAVRAALARVQERGGHMPRPQPTTELAQSGAEDNRQTDPYVATGMLMERLQLDYERAYEALCAQAQAESRSVQALAKAMVQAAARVNDPNT